MDEGQHNPHEAPLSESGQTAGYCALAIGSAWLFAVSAVCLTILIGMYNPATDDNTDPKIVWTWLLIQALISAGLIGWSLNRLRRRRP
jgi:hypothetical protein